MVLPLVACSSGGTGAVPAEPLHLADISATLDLGDDTVKELFTSDVPVKFALAADFDQLDKDRSQETEDRPAQVFVNDLGGNPVEIEMQVRTRGKFRLQRRICPDPPLRLNFPETRPHNTVFDGQDKLKLVTHCRDSDRYEQNLLEEYLVYRIYNQLTDIGFRVQLAEITYLDVRGEDDPITRMAFIIEDEDALATRLGGSMIETETATPEDFELDQLSLFYLYQFLVGNVDWGTRVGHNIKILNMDWEYYPIPYDFDWTGFVDAPYSGPNELTVDLHRSVRERVYWGVCLPGIDYPGLYLKFNEKRDAILDVINRPIGLSEDNVKAAVAYVDEFYDIINDQRRSDRMIKRACRPYR
jgi:hypothetical protein